MGKGQAESCLTILVHNGVLEKIVIYYVSGPAPFPVECRPFRDLYATTRSIQRFFFTQFWNFWLYGDPWRIFQVSFLSSVDKWFQIANGATGLIGWGMKYIFKLWFLVVVLLSTMELTYDVIAAFVKDLNRFFVCKTQNGMGRWNF